MMRLEGNAIGLQELSCLDNFFSRFSKYFLEPTWKRSDVEVKAKQWLMWYWLKWIYGANSTLMVRSELKCFRRASTGRRKSDWDVSWRCSDSTTSLSLQTIIFQKHSRIFKAWKDVARENAKRQFIGRNLCWFSCAQHKYFVCAFRCNCLITLTTVFANNFVKGDNLSFCKVIWNCQQCFTHFLKSQNPK